MDMLDRIIKLMKEHKESKAALARNAGIPYTTIDGLFKRGCDNVYISTARKICDYYGVTLDYLVLGNEGLSNSATLVAAQYDKLDKSGQELINMVIDHEMLRVYPNTPHAQQTAGDIFGAKPRNHTEIAEAE